MKFDVWLLPEEIMNYKIPDFPTRLGYYTKSSKSSENYLREELYQKSTGEYFMLIETCSDVLAISTTEEFAKEWCKKHLPEEEYISIFGEVEE